LLDKAVITQSHYPAVRDGWTELGEEVKKQIREKENQN